MEGFALEFHFESGGRKLSLGKKTFNPSFLIYDEQSLSRFCLVSVFESLSPKLKNQEEGNNRRRGKLGEKSMFSCRFKKKKRRHFCCLFLCSAFLSCEFRMCFSIWPCCVYSQGISYILCMCFQVESVFLICMCFLRWLNFKTVNLDSQMIRFWWSNVTVPSQNMCLAIT